jgi:hypothetical protein
MGSSPSSREFPSQGRAGRILPELAPTPARPLVDRSKDGAKFIKQIRRVRAVSADGLAGRGDPVRMAVGKFGAARRQFLPPRPMIGSAARKRPSPASVGQAFTLSAGERLQRID